MGYDLYIKDAPGEEERAAVAAAAERLKEAQAAGKGIAEAYAALDAANRSYFRFSIWSIGAAEELMSSFGMLSFEAAPDWPDPGAEGYTAAMEALRKNPEDTAARKALDEVTARMEGVHEQIRNFDPEGPGIAAYKLGSNDGWLVSPREIGAALEAYEKAPVEDREAAGREFDPWVPWIGFLTEARGRGGFHVH
ncbi:hypothetical protein [Streptomyces bambusae]